MKLLTLKPKVTLLVGDVMEKLDGVPDKSIQCVMTSVPYFGLRDYSRCQNMSPNCPDCQGRGIIESVRERQIGLEQSVSEWTQTLVLVFRKVRRVLRDDGTLWLNVGDSYAGDGGARRDQEIGARGNIPESDPEFYGKWKKDWGSLKNKDLVGQPWRLAFALQDDGWYLRSDIVWHKPNPQPESVPDRPTRAHEFIFMFAKSERYFFDHAAVREAASENSVKRVYQKNFSGESNGERNGAANDSDPGNPGRHMRSVWTVPTQRYALAHFATFPEEIPARCIKAATSAHGACGKCGAPWERVLKVLGYGSWHDHSENMTKGARQGASKRFSDYKNKYQPPETRGWQPTCECNGKLVKKTVKVIGYGDWADYELNESQGALSNIKKRRDLQPKEVEKDVFVYEPSIPLEEHPIARCVVLDPFAGSGTTGIVARNLGRSALLIELSPAYAEVCKKRVNIHQRALGEEE